MSSGICILSCLFQRLDSLIGIQSARVSPTWLLHVMQARRFFDHEAPSRYIPWKWPREGFFRSVSGRMPKCNKRIVVRLHEVTRSLSELSFSHSPMVPTKSLPSRTSSRYPLNLRQQIHRSVSRSNKNRERYFRILLHQDFRKFEK